jgi:integrase/recombinase XerD
LDAGWETLHICEAKNHCERFAVLTAQGTPKSIRGLRAFLKRVEHRSPSSALFLSNRGTPVTYDALEYNWSKVCQNAGFVENGRPRYTLHQLRHTRATELIEQQ